MDKKKKKSEESDKQGVGAFNLIFFFSSLSFGNVGEWMFEIWSDHDQNH